MLISPLCLIFALKFFCILHMLTRQRGLIYITCLHGYKRIIKWLPFWTKVYNCPYRPFVKLLVTYQMITTIDRRQVNNLSFQGCFSCNSFFNPLINSYRQSICDKLIRGHLFAIRRLMDMRVASSTTSHKQYVIVVPMLSLSNISITKKSVSSAGFPNTKNWVGKARRSRVFLSFFLSFFFNRLREVWMPDKTFHFWFYF